MAEIERLGYQHGTATASLLVAAGSSGADEEAYAASVLLKLDAVDISSNSWGPNTCMQRLASDRRLQQCSFKSLDASAPCEVCGNSIDLNNQQCLEAIKAHCITYFTIDEAACTDYFDAYAICKYDALSEEYSQQLATAVTKGRSGKGIVVGKSLL